MLHVLFIPVLSFPFLSFPFLSFFMSDEDGLYLYIFDLEDMDEWYNISNEVCISGTKKNSEGNILNNIQGAKENNFKNSNNNFYLFLFIFVSGDCYVWTCEDDSHSRTTFSAAHGVPRAFVER